MSAPNRRLWLSAATAAVLGLGAWRMVERRRAVAPPPLGEVPSNAPSAAASNTDSGDLWAQRFTRPEGGELVLAELRGKPTVLNFWATWCPPCVKEMPELDRFAREFGPRGWQVVGIAVDSPDPVRDFLKKTPVSFPIGLAGFGGSEIARTLGNTQGGLPFSVVLDAAGHVTHRKLGATHFDELASWAA